MPVSSHFYESGLGDRLADPSCQPEGIIAFLQEELKMIDSLQSSMDLLIEAGCMHGLHLDWAIEQKKSYLGFDLVNRYIEIGKQTVTRKKLPQERYRFVVGDAVNLAQIVDQHVSTERSRCLLLFPFNSFGNMQHIEQIIDSLQKSNLSFLISSYQTNKVATACRYDYYTKCGYKDVVCSNTEQGVHFSSSDGLCSIAYYPDYLTKLCSRYNLPIKSIEVSSINAFYMRHI